MFAWFAPLSVIDGQGGIQEALNGKWLFYSGGAVDPTCPKWGVRPCEDFFTTGFHGSWKKYIHIYAYK